VGDWAAQDPGDRYVCFVCDEATLGARANEYVEVDIRYSAPTYVLSVGAHVECLCRVAAPGSAVHDTPQERAQGDERGPRRHPDQPPVTFPVYGVATRVWPGPRWFHSAESEAGGALSTVTLRHGMDSWPNCGANSWLSVESVDVPNLLGSAYGRRSAAAVMAHRGLLHLVNQVPAPEVPPQLSDRFWRRVLNNVVEPRSADWGSWPISSWTVDGRPIQARVLQFGGGWTGFAEVAASSGVIVNGAGIEPAELELETVTDGASYGFDLAAPITADTAIRAREAALGGDDEAPDWDPSVVHPDMLALFGDQ
jgi:hypothetical protein